MRRSAWGFIPLLVVGGVAAGCGGGREGPTYVTRYPTWDYGTYKRLAVLPTGTSDGRAAQDANVLNDRLTTLLSQNREFEVLSRAEFADVMKEQDLARLAEAVDEGGALPEGTIKIAQAVVATNITDYRLVREKETRAVPVFGIDRRTGRPVQVGEERVVVYTHGAEVEGSVRVVDVATNSILMSHSARIVPQPRTGRNRPPDATPEEMASAALRELAVEFYKTIAPTRLRVELDEKMLFLATGYFDGRYDSIKRVPRDLASVQLVVRGLPAAAERNPFRVGISAVGGRENLFEREFIWSSSAGPEGIASEVPVDRLLSSGAEQFVAKLYSGPDPQPILERPFAFEKVRQ